MITQDKTLDKYTADGTQAAFPVTFPIYAATDVTVTLGAADGTESVLTLGNDYSVAVSASGAGGTVTLAAAPAAGVIVAIALSLPLVQMLDLSSTATIDVDALEREQDKQVQMIQQTASQLGRAVKVPVTSSDTPEGVMQSLYTARDDAAASADAASTCETNAGTSAAAAAGSAHAAAVSEDNAADSAIRAQAWAESDASPDPDDSTKKSAKSWAQYAATVSLGASVTPTANRIPLAGDDGKIADGWVNITAIPSANKVPKAGSDGKIDSGWLNANAKVPAGSVLFNYAGSMTGYLLCTGAAVSRTTYAALFAVIGTQFGSGDGSTTFNLPDMRGRTLQGANGDNGYMKEAGLPNATGAFQTSRVGDVAPDAFGIFSRVSIYNGFGGGGSTQMKWAEMAASLANSNAIYGASNTVQPPAIALNAFIKY